MTVIEMTASPPGIHNLRISPVNDLSLKRAYHTTVTMKPCNGKSLKESFYEQNEQNYPKKFPLKVHTVL